MPAADVPVHRPSPVLSSRFLRDLPYHRGLPDCRRPLGRDRTTCLTLVRSHWGIALRFGCPILFSGPCPSQLYVGSSVRSLPPFVHGFPDPGNISRIARRRHTGFSLQYVHPLLSVLQGFLLHTVTSASSALSLRYCPWICHPLPLPASGSPRRFGLLSSLATSTTGQEGFPG
jgi:hypothetical protein